MRPLPVSCGESPLSNLHNPPRRGRWSLQGECPARGRALGYSVPREAAWYRSTLTGRQWHPEPGDSQKRASIDCVIDRKTEKDFGHGQIESTQRSLAVPWGVGTALCVECGRPARLAATGELSASIGRGIDGKRFSGFLFAMIASIIFLLV